MSVYPEAADVRRQAKMSEDEAYLYSLHRSWGQHGSVMRVVTLHPTLDDPIKDDATTTSLVRLAVRLGHIALFVYNVYALRVSRPSDLWEPGVDPVGPANDSVIMAAANEAYAKNASMIAAWGAGAKADRIKHVRAMTDGVEWVSLGPLMPSGNPRHPLFLGNVSTLEPLPAVKHV